MKTRVTMAALAALEKRYLAYVRRNEDGSFVIHDLEQPLRAVGDLAGEFAAIFGHFDLGQLVELWHDLGELYD